MATSVTLVPWPFANPASSFGCSWELCIKLSGLLLATPLHAAVQASYACTSQTDSASCGQHSQCQWDAQVNMCYLGATALEGLLAPTGTPLGDYIAQGEH